MLRKSRVTLIVLNLKTILLQLDNFQAHKMILSACSPYFKALLEENPAKHPIIILKVRVHLLSDRTDRPMAIAFAFGELTQTNYQLPIRRTSC